MQRDLSRRAAHATGNYRESYRMAQIMLDAENLGPVGSDTEHGRIPDSGYASCGSRSGRWYCVETERFRETEVRDRLEDQQYGVFLPQVVEMRAIKPGVMRASAVAAFPRYVLVRFDIRAQPWRSIVYTRGVRGLFSSSPDNPTPLPQKQVDVLFALGYDRPIVKDPTPDLIEAGARVRVTAGAFADHEGVCLWDDAKRVRLLMDILGSARQFTVERKDVVKMVGVRG